MTAPAIFTPMAGGLGDILAYYLEGQLGYFPALKRVGARTMVRTWSCSDQVDDLFSYNPHVDALVTRPFHQHVGDFYQWAQRQERTFRLMSEAEQNCATWEQPAFYLNDTEYEFLQDTEAGAPYVAVHPFAGRVERRLDAAEIVHAAAEHMRVIVLGGDSRRNGEPIVERFDRFHWNVVSVVNKCSIRLQASIVKRASKFIGSVSAYNSVAAHFKVPSLIFGSAANRQQMQNPVGVFAKMQENNAQIYYQDQRPDIPELVRRFVQ